MELLLSFNNSPSLAIRALLSDGKSCEFTIFLKPKHLYNYSSKHVLALPSNEEKQNSYKKGEFDITQDLICKLQKLMICQFKDFYSRSWDLRKRFVVVPKLREFVDQEKFIPIGRSTFEDEIQDQNNDTDEVFLGYVTLFFVVYLIKTSLFGL
ncbi:hypothetical protein LIER_42941 [Lithospermum erythrorhizon]|uniref:Uncharacterized protein n=1 Tax=Lithospermum erythrorhizon TaxID=34254 RepID=A0AAV3P7J8_LITER